MVFKLKACPAITEVMLWYDPVRHTPLKRSIQFKRDSVEGTAVEYVQEILLNRDIPDEKFKLPEEKK